MKCCFRSVLAACQVGEHACSIRSYVGTLEYGRGASSQGSVGVVVVGSGDRLKSSDSGQ